MSGINFKAMALPPGRGGYTQQAQAQAWRDYLAWERGNPQRLDGPTYVARWAAPLGAAPCARSIEFCWRVQGARRSSGAHSGSPLPLQCCPPRVCRVSLAFEQALMVLFHYPDTWLEFARWWAFGAAVCAAPGSIHCWRVLLAACRALA